MTFRNQLRTGAVRLLPATLGVVAALGLSASAALAQSASAGSATPSAQEFAGAASDTANWILPAKSYSGNHYTDATQITPANVAGLHLAW
ncbi:MAG TPA: hypothetical protein VIJ55_11430, partial [Acetobacteraceae bacterium]